MSSSELVNRRTLFSLLLPALTTLFGLQMLRILLPSLVWYLGDTVGVSSAILGLVAFGIFLVSFLAAVWQRLWRPQAALLVTAGGLGLLRLAEQISTSPPADLVLAGLGTALFTFFFPIYLGTVHTHDGQAAQRLGLGFLVGLTLDTAVHGACGTLDLSWQRGLVAPLLVLVLVVLQWWALSQTPTPAGRLTEGRLLHLLPLAAMGPFLFLSAIFLQNVARVATLTGWTLPSALALILVADGVGLALARLPIGRPLALVGAAVLTVLMVPQEPSGAAAAAVFFLANALAFPLVAVLFRGLEASADRASRWRTAVANGIGWLLFALFAFLYYVAYDLPVGIPNAIFAPLAAALMGLGALGVPSTLLRRSPGWDWTPVTVAVALLLAPLVLTTVWHTPISSAGEGFPVRVMTYNLHNGFNTGGRLDPEEIARTIEQTGADIVGLQEVERGWYIDGSLDLLGWLSRRLGMPYVYGPTADPVWGNAILSRYPIQEWGNEPLPPRTLLLKRGFLWARVDLGSGDELLFVATHWHHIEEDSEIRQQQAPVMAAFWNGRPGTVLVGDLNAEPDAPEIETLRQAGLGDAFATVGAGTGLSWPSDQPEVRIDYIWFSPDLVVSDLVMPDSTASDHIGIAVTVNRR